MKIALVSVLVALGCAAGCRPVGRGPSAPPIAALPADPGQDGDGGYTLVTAAAAVGVGLIYAAVFGRR